MINQDFKETSIWREILLNISTSHMNIHVCMERDVLKAYCFYKLDENVREFENITLPMTTGVELSVSSLRLPLFIINIDEGRVDSYDSDLYWYYEEADDAICLCLDWSEYWLS